MLTLFSRPQVLPEPCDPRNPESKDKCLPNNGLKALPGPDGEIEGLGGKVYRADGAPKVRPFLSVPDEEETAAAAAQP